MVFRTYPLNLLPLVSMLDGRPLVERVYHPGVRRAYLIHLPWEPRSVPVCPTRLVCLHLVLVSMPLGPNPLVLQAYHPGV